MSQTIEVRFKGTRKAYFLWEDAEAPLRTGEAVLVEVERGRDFGRVTAVGDVAAKKCGGGCTGCAVGGETEAAEPVAPKPVVRRATPDDQRMHAENRRAEDDARRQVIERVRTHDLVMKVSDTEWQWDRNKLTIYFTAEKRVDFRALVRDLASLFRTRIELRQIGVRDEAARLSGVGRCGREYCCSSWLKELSPVNLGLAKDQHLSLNPSQISGGCGRLLCCLKYEHEFYVTTRRRFPKEGKTITGARGPERVVAVDIFRERVFLRSEEHGSRIVPLVQLREELEALGEVLMTAESRSRMVVTEAVILPAAAVGEAAMIGEPAGELGDPAAELGAATSEAAAGPVGPPHRRRRRRPRGGRRRGRAGRRRWGPERTGGWRTRLDCGCGDDRAPRARDLLTGCRCRQRRSLASRPQGAPPVPKFYLTTAIDYSNGDPHLGHALEKVGADCIARYRRLRGDDVHFLMGMDEHSQAVLQAAEQNGLPPQAWVDRMAETFETYWQRLECSHDEWIRTTDPRHQRGVTALLEQIARANPDDLFVGEYEGLYCIGCEEFKQPAQIVNGRCIEHPTLELVPTKERNHFFRLTRYRDRLLALIRTGELRVEPTIRRNEIVRLLEDGLQDISVSRNRQSWGIPFPGDPDQTVYVWFDALINYLSATGYPGPGYERLWPADLHVVGKGITRFHCVIWPAMLLSAGVALPREVWAHGYVQWEGAKMSKSAGTAVNLGEAIDRYGPDALRYFLLREVGFEADGNFTWERFDERYTADLADGLGNLASRSLAMLEKYRVGIVPDRAEETALDAAGRTAVAAYARAMDALDLRGGAEAAWGLVATANLYIQQVAPWALAKAGREAELDVALAALARALHRLAVLAGPFIPGKAQLLWQSLSLASEKLATAWPDLDAPSVAGLITSKPDALFPKPASV